MKHKRLKNYLKLVIVFWGFVFFLISCQKEEETITDTLQNDALIYYQLQSFNEFANTSSLKLLTSSVDKINTVRNAFSRTAEDNSFVIDSSKVAIINHVSGYSSQTFVVQTEPTNTVLENLLIATKTDGTEQALLITYYLNTEISNITQADFESHVLETSIQDLEDYSISFLSRETEFCWDQDFLNTIQCDGGMLVTPSSHPECFDENNQNVGSVTIITTSRICETTGGGGTTSPDTNDPVDGDDDPFGDWGGSGGDGTGTGTGGQNTDENKDDNPCDENGTSTSISDGNGNCIDGIGVPLVPDPPTEDCQDLKDKISNVLSIKARLNELRQGIGSSNFEQGFKANKISTGNYTPGTIQTNNSNGGNHVNIRPNSQTTVIAHTHPASVDYKMFSAEDILKMAEMANKVVNSSNSNVQLTEITHIVMFNNNENPNDPKAFALRFDNASEAQNLRAILNNPNDREDFEETLENDYNSDDSGPPSYNPETTLGKQQRHLFNLLEKYNLSMSLYEANFDANGFINGWQKINKESLAKEPCN